LKSILRKNGYLTRWGSNWPREYDSASEVVREALRLLEQEDQLRALKMQRLRQDIREGLDSGPSKVFDPQGIKRAAREKKSAKSASK